MLLIRELYPAIWIRAASSEQFWHPRLVQENVKTPNDSADVIKRFIQALTCLVCSHFFLLFAAALLYVRYDKIDAFPLKKHLNTGKNNRRCSCDPKVFELWVFVISWFILHTEPDKVKAGNEERNHPNTSCHGKYEPNYLYRTCFDDTLYVLVTFLLIFAFIKQRLF